MKVLIVAQYYPPHVGGLEMVAQRQAKSLAVAGHAVTVVTCCVGDALPGDQMEDKVMVRRARAINYLDRHFGLPFALPGLKFLRHLARGIEEADVVQLHDVFYPASWLGYLFARYYRRPLILMQHVGLVAHPNRFVCLVQRIVYGTIGRSTFQSAERLIVFNRNVKDFLLKNGVNAGKISELRNGVDLQQFHPGLNAAEKKQVRSKFGLSLDKPIVLFVGRFVPKKGFGVLLDAADETFETVLVGCGNVPRQFKERSSVKFTGALTQGQLSELYRVSDLFVLPAIGEVFTVAMQEAMASGVPVITTDDPGYASYELDRRLISLVAPTSTEIKRTILSLLGDKAQRRQMAYYSRRIAEEWFDWRKNAAALDDIVLEAA